MILITKNLKKYSLDHIGSTHRRFCGTWEMSENKEGKYYLVEDVDSLLYSLQLESNRLARKLNYLKNITNWYGDVIVPEDFRSEEDNHV